LRHVATSGESEERDDDPACFTVHRNDSSGIVNEIRAECIIGRDEPDLANSATADDVEKAIHVAIKFAVDAGDYERASALLDVAKRSTGNGRAR
jgi:hypothetical protein